MDAQSRDIQKLKARLKYLSASLQRTEKSRRRYQALFEHAPNGYLLTDLGGTIYKVNQAAANLLNTPATEIRGKSLLQFHPPQERSDLLRRLAQLQSDLKTAMSASSPGVEPGQAPDCQRCFQEWETMIQPEGKAAFYAALATSPLWIDDHLGLMWSIRSIHTYKLEVKAAQDSEKHFRTLAETSSVAIFLVRGDRIEYANQAAIQMLGYSQAEILHRPFSDFIHPPDDARIARLLQVTNRKEMSERTTPLHALRSEVSLIPKHGDECWVDLTLGVTEIGEKIMWVVTAYDTTQRVQGERRQKELLQAIVSFLEAERGRIAREMHDQMGQTVTALILGLKGLEPYLKAGVAVRRRLEQLQAMVDELSQDMHRVAFELRPTSLDDLGLKSALANLIDDWGERHQIATEFEVVAYPDERLSGEVTSAIYRIVQEALNNILKHAGATQVSVILDCRNGIAKAVIEDNGSGFEFKEGVHWQGGPHRLGLYGMMERAALLGGKVNIETAPGQGTTIYVSIPY